jgi:hypothetical protein
MSARWSELLRSLGIPETMWKMHEFVGQADSLPGPMPIGQLPLWQAISLPHKLSRVPRPQEL